MVNELEAVFENAIKAFRDNFAQAQVQVIKEIEHNQQPRPDDKVDKIIEMTIGEKRVEYYVEIKRNLQRPNIGVLIGLRHFLPGPLLLVTNYVNPAIAEDLRKNKIEYLDATGNAYIDQPPLYIHMKGNKPINRWLEVIRDEAFRGTGLRVVFIFLCNPEMVNRNYRVIAHAAGIALGNIGLIMKDLIKQGFLLDMGKKGYRLVNKKRLLDRFVEYYPIKLRQRLLEGKFQGNLDWRKTEPLGFDALWGGEAAAARITDYLKPQNLTVYAPPYLINTFLIEYKLKKDPFGEIEILELFWEPPNLFNNKGAVHPILVYADLMATTNNRNVETAQVIYDRYIAQLIRED